MTDAITTLSLLDVAEYLGYLAGAWGLGYASGFTLTNIKKFFEIVG